jgi:uncharacterized protein involved in response to NO
MTALLALGFRPFYLLAGAYAALSVPIWILQYFGVLPPVQPLWHAHEMVFGYAFAVIGGFLLTAVRAWTGLPTPSGTPLALLAALWVAARAIAPFSLAVSSAVDLMFAAGLAWGIGRPILASRNRNWFFILIVLAIGAASVLFALSTRTGLQVGLDMVLLVIAIMAGRVVPGFTNNAIPGAGARRMQSLEYAALASVLAILGLDLLGFGKAAAMVALLAAALHAVRLALWAPLATRRRPILWILHLSYAWIVVHLAMRGLSEFLPLPPVLATHALTVGAIGGITVGMMTRTARGHTARPLTAGRAEIWAYVLVHAAAFVRVLVPLAVPSAYLASVGVSALLWGLAFAIFTVAYLPILSRPRLDGKPG